MSRLPSNDGWHDIAYDLGDDPEDNARLSRILNEATHVFHLHKEGTWRTQDKDAYAALLAAEIEQRPGLTGRLLDTDDRVVKMLTYRALELIADAGPKAEAEPVVVPSTNMPTGYFIGPALAQLGRFYDGLMARRRNRRG